MDCAVGIDLGGSSVKAVAVTADGRKLAERSAEFADTTDRDWATLVQRLYRELHDEIRIAGFANSTAPRAGVSAPGLAAAHGRAIAWMPGRLQGLENLDWTDLLQCPHTVPVLNDAHAALLGESWIGAARGFQNVFLLTLGTGVGGAAMVDGRLLRGHIGRAGHLGHVCLNLQGAPDVTGMRGSLEMLIGNCTIRERTGGRFATTHELVAAHRAGDQHATDIWLASVRALAYAVASYVNVLDPQAVVIGGGIAKAGEALFAPLNQFMAEVEWRPGGHAARIVPAQLGALAGAFGAAWNALNGAWRTAKTA